MWAQDYDPFGNPLLSTLTAAVPIVVLLGCIAFLKMKAHIAALLGIASSLAIAIFAFQMPAGMATLTAAFGAAYGLMPIGWIILNVIFLYRLTEQRGQFRILQDSIAAITPDRRLQLLLIAFGFGAFFEGAAGFGTPVAVTGAMLIGLGFSPLAASGLSLIANTAPVAFGALGTPILALASVTGLDVLELSGMVGRQLPFFAVIVPFWLIGAFAGWRGMLQVWPAILVAGVAFAIPQYLVSNFHGPWLVDVVAAVCSMGALTLFLRVWRPATIWRSTKRGEPDVVGVANGPTVTTYTSEQVFKAWLPWIVLSVCVFLWGIPQVKAWLDSLFIIKLPVSGLHQLVQKVPPIVAMPTSEAAVYNFNLLSMTGTSILLAAVISSALMKFSVRDFLREYFTTLVVVRWSRLCHPLLGRGRHDGAGLRPNRLAVSSVWNHARLAWRCAHRFGYCIERAVRRLAEGHFRTTRTQSRADGCGQQLRRRNGKDDRCPEHRCCVHGDALVRP